MLPIFDIFSVVRVYSFGLFLVLAFLFGLFIFWRKGREDHFDEGLLLDAGITASFWALVGARAGFILVNWQAFGFQVLKWVSLFAYPGYAGMFGIVSGFIALAVFARKHRWDTYKVLDFGVLGVSLAFVFLFLGMFLNGSGFGNPTTLLVGMQFPGVFDRRHPVQLYGALLYLVTFGVLMKLELEYRTFLWYRARKRSAQPGFLLACFVMAYGAINLVLALFRPVLFRVWGVPLDPFMNALIILLGMGILYNRSGREFPLFHTKKK